MVLYVPKCIQERRIITPESAGLAGLLEQASDKAKVTLKRCGFDIRNDSVTFRFIQGPQRLLNGLKLWVHGDPHIGIYSSVKAITEPYDLRSTEIVAHAGDISDFSSENTSILRREASEDEYWFNAGDSLLNKAARKYHLADVYAQYNAKYGPSVVDQALQFVFSFGQK